MNENEPDLLDMMKNHELAIKRLYETFALKFTENQALWKDLIKGEQKHALWIEKLRSYPAVDRWMKENIKVRPQAIRSSISYIETRVKEAEEGGLTALQALSVAADIEAALIEKQFSRLNNSSSEKINSIMAALASETESHREKIAEAINSEKRSQF